MIHRITGTHAFISSFGAALWLDIDPNGGEAQFDHIQEKVAYALNELGLSDMASLSQRRIYETEVFVLAAPVDLLYTACSILEWAIGLVKEFDSVRREYSSEENLAWRTIRSWALKNGVPCVDDEDGLTLGMGQASRTWKLNNLPSVEQLDTVQFRRVPSVYITGTNGKTTTSRMLSAICHADPKFNGVGQTSTDGVRVNGDWVERGDWTGPGAARMILRDQRVDVAILETARGGLMRRGLVIDDVDACTITNVSDDHLGTWGLQTVYDMAVAKLTVALGVKNGGGVLLNADCAILMSAWNDVQSRYPKRDWTVQFFSSQQTEGMTVYVEDGWVHHLKLGKITRVIDIPLSLGGRAQYNVENAMAAIGLAHWMGCSVQSMKTGVCSLVPTVEDSRGRSNWLRYNNADIFVDFAHNPDGIRRVVEMGQRWDATRKGIVLGQAGDRQDDEIRGIGHQAAELNADHYFLKELPGHAYEREATDVVELLSAALQEKGVLSTQISVYKSDLQGAQAAMDWVMEGDLLILLSHEQLDDVMEMVLNRGCTWGYSQG